MIRIRLTPDDVRQLTIAGPDQLSELVYNAYSFMSGQLPPVERRRIARSLTGAARPLLDLVGHPYGFPDFLTPGSGSDLDSALDLALATPADRLRSELAPFVRRTSAREPERVRAALRPAVHTYQRDVFAARWEAAAASVAADRAIRGRLLAEHGIDLLLATLHPDIHWAYPVLTLPCIGTFDYQLRGRGLRLVPTHYAQVPAVADRPDGPFEVYYPARGDAQRTRQARGALELLLGRTRAAVLAAIADGVTTSQIAWRLGISIASASEHATVLRNAGLVASGRSRTAVVHALTPLGADLVTTALRDASA